MIIGLGWPYRCANTYLTINQYQFCHGLLIIFFVSNDLQRTSVMERCWHVCYRGYSFTSVYFKIVKVMCEFFTQELKKKVKYDRSSEWNWYIYYGPHIKCKSSCLDISSGSFLPLLLMRPDYYLGLGHYPVFWSMHFTVISFHGICYVEGKYPCLLCGSCAQHQCVGTNT